MSNTVSIYKLLKDPHVQSDLIPDKTNGFLLSLMAISAYVVTADHIVMEGETAFVQSFLQKYYGEADAREYFSIFRQLIAVFKREGRQPLVPKIQRCCTYIVHCFYDEKEALSLVTKYLHLLAASDNATSTEETKAIKELTLWLDKP